MAMTKSRCIQFFGYSGNMVSLQLCTYPISSQFKYQIHFFDARDEFQVFHHKSFIRQQVALQVIFKIAFSIDHQSANESLAPIATIAYLHTSGM